MSFADFKTIEQLLLVLGTYRSIAYPILFLGAFFETLIPFSFVIYGELFFLSGALLAGFGTLDLWIVAPVLYLGGILGDNGSYWLGRRYGMNIFDRLSRWPLTRRCLTETARRRGLSFFHRRGEAAVFLARLAGPFSWFVPALAGVFRQPYRRFLVFNALGVVIGISQFLVLGYLLGDNFDQIAAWLTRLGSVPLAIIASLAVAAGAMIVRGSRHAGP